MIVSGGILQQKKGLFYAVIYFYDDAGDRVPKWIPTGIKVQGGKREADKILREILYGYEHEKIQEDKTKEEDIRFVDFMQIWLEYMDNKVEPNTLESYKLVYDVHIKPYFQQKNILLRDLTAEHIEGYYDFLRKSGRANGNGGLSESTIKHHHANISKCLQYALKKQKIQANPARAVELGIIPKRNRAKALKITQIEILLDIFKGDPIEAAVYLTVFYGLRRSEVLGLRWSAIDFSDGTITVEHKVVKMAKGPALEKDGTKNTSSLRTLPLIDGIGDYLKTLKHKQEQMAALQPNDYQKSDYICVDGTGKLQRPDFITQHYALILNKNNVKHMRFHDLRHHAATYLHKMGFSFKEIQEWLGHSSIKTTMDIYTALELEDKKKIAKKLNETYKIPV